ncbi:hypothetical protein ElyMa_006476800 [Elysia marginata]|uniref:Uncharacterized protein n=1 Tax=Elysia marginata TaxID=1093978 RepID=A0AAV4I0V5_9GAST|nr:hypothetical protein ElyMa_006476800 [Elysia marginata]
MIITLRSSLGLGLELSCPPPPHTHPVLMVHALVFRAIWGVGFRDSVMGKTQERPLGLCLRLLFLWAGRTRYDTGKGYGTRSAQSHP